MANSSMNDLAAFLTGFGGAYLGTKEKRRQRQIQDQELEMAQKRLEQQTELSRMQMQERRERQRDRWVNDLKVAERNAAILGDEELSKAFSKAAMQVQDTNATLVGMMGVPKEIRDLYMSNADSLSTAVAMREAQYQEQMRKLGLRKEKTNTAQAIEDLTHTKDMNPITKGLGETNLAAAKNALSKEQSDTMRKLLMQSYTAAEYAGDEATIEKLAPLLVKPILEESDAPLIENTFDSLVNAGKLKIREYREEKETKQATDYLDLLKQSYVVNRQDTDVKMELMQQMDTPETRKAYLDSRMKTDQIGEELSRLTKMMEPESIRTKMQALQPQPEQQPQAQQQPEAVPEKQQKGLLEWLVGADRNAPVKRLNITGPPKFEDLIAPKPTQNAAPPLAQGAQPSPYQWNGGMSTLQAQAPPTNDENVKKLLQALGLLYQDNRVAF